MSMRAVLLNCSSWLQELASNSGCYARDGIESPSGTQTLYSHTYILSNCETVFCIYELMPVVCLSQVDCALR